MIAWINGWYMYSTCTRWKYGWIDEWMERWMDAWKYRWLYEWTENVRIDWYSVDRSMIDDWMDENMDVQKVTAIIPPPSVYYSVSSCYFYVYVPLVLTNMIQFINCWWFF